MFSHVENYLSEKKKTTDDHRIIKKNGRVYIKLRSEDELDKVGVPFSKWASQFSQEPNNEPERKKVKKSAFIKG